MASSEAMDLLIAHRVGLERYSTYLVEQIDELLSAAQVDIEMQLRSGLAQINGRGRLSATEEKRLRDTLARVRMMQLEAHATLSGQLDSDWSNLAAHEADWSLRFYGQGLGLSTQLTKPSAQMLAAIVSTDPLGDKHLSAWVKKLTTDQIAAVGRQIRIGLIQGEPTDKILQRLKGRPETGGRDGVFPGTRNAARVLVRTSVNHVTARAHDMFLKENPQAFPAYLWVAVLDARTTIICQALSGQKFKTGEGPLPPAHPNCRSTIVGIPFGVDDIGLMSYSDWLKKQPPSVVWDILGPARARLFLSGKMPMDRFISRAGEALTLDQIRERETEAWTRAFGSPAGSPHTRSRATSPPP